MGTSFGAHVAGASLDGETNLPSLWMNSGRGGKFEPMARLSGSPPKLPLLEETLKIDRMAKYTGERKIVVPALSKGRAARRQRAAGSSARQFPP